MIIENPSECSGFDSAFNLPNVKYDWYQKDSDKVVITIYIKGVVSAFPVFKEKEVHLRFKTQDEKIHSQYNLSPCTALCWGVTLSHTVIPHQCSFMQKTNSLDMILKKKEIVKWNSLSLPILPGSISANHIVGGARIATKEVRSSWSPGLGQTRPAEPQVETHPSVGQGNMNKNEEKREPQAMMQETLQMSDKGGYTGLDNLGNTCFMSSVLQALANTRELRDYFLSRSYESDINTENPFGAGGRLAQAFYVLLKNLWAGELMSFNPAKLKSIVAKRAPQFNGYMQHDAQEFMVFLLDGLHEEVNRIKQKKPSKILDMPGQNDHLMAREAWKLHKSHNDSFIVDKFHGQYKSKLVCPNCGEESVTYDPFLFLPVPLPKQTKKLNVIYLPRSPSEGPHKMAVHIPKDGGVAGDVLHLVARRLSISPENLRLFESYKCQVHKHFSASYPMSFITDSDLLIMCEVLSPQVVPGPVYEITVTQQLALPKIIEKCTKCGRAKDVGCGIKLKRCTKCYRAAYCDQECQKAHWSEHKNVCKRTPQHVGFPFIISVEKTKATYHELCEMVLNQALSSVSVRMNSKPESSLGGAGDLEVERLDLAGCGNTKPFKLQYLTTSGETNTIQYEDNNPLFLEGVTNLVLEWKNNPNSSNSVTVTNKHLKLDEVNVNGRGGDTTKLQDCIQLFTEPEVLAAQEAWYCPTCKEHRQATKQLSLWQLPDVLIIQLKRFSFKSMIWRDKIDKLVEFPVRGLDMRPFCITSGNDEKPPIYDLFSVINHHGGIFGGHYTSYVRLPDENDSSKSSIGWRLCDDNHVSTVHSEQQVITKSAYVMFYHRRKCFPSPKPVYSNPVCNGDDIDVDNAEMKEKEVSFEKDPYANYEHHSLSHIGAVGGSHAENLPSASHIASPKRNRTKVEDDALPSTSYTSQSRSVEKKEEDSTAISTDNNHSEEEIFHDARLNQGPSTDELEYTDMDAVD